MGCKMTKLLKREQKGKEESKEAILPEPPPPAPPDPRLPLSARQKFSIVKSWKGINRAMEATGVTMFLKLFEEHAELLTLFDKLKELQTRDQQAESLELAEHATIVMNSIDEGIRAMDNVDFFFDLLHQIGASHRRLPGFRKEYFWRIERPFLEAVKLTLDERFTENIEKVYKITIKFLIETVIQGYDMAEEKEVNDNVTQMKSPTSGSTSPSSPTIPLLVAKSEHSQQNVNAFIMNIKSSANASFSSAKSNSSSTSPTEGENEKSVEQKSSPKGNNNKES